MAHTLPDLPYAFEALEPHIDAMTMQIHHGKHHQAYVSNLNTALEGHEALQGLSVEDLLRRIEEVPEKIRPAVRNNGGGHANHSLFWLIMSAGGGNPSGALKDAIDKKFGSLNAFKEKFANEAKGRFGSGWSWLVVTADKQIDCYSTQNQDSPYMQGQIPIMGLDVWEHAYYLKYQNRRPDYVTAWWNVVNWAQIEANYARALK